MIHTKRSPIKSKPLGNPSQSIEREIETVFDKNVLDSLFLVSIMSSMTLIAWLQFLFKIPPLTYAIIASIFFVPGCGYAVLKILKARKEIKRLKMARDGEQAVAEYLDLLKNESCFVLHDLVGDDFNIDHIVIAPQGVFTIKNAF